MRRRIEDERALRRHTEGAHRACVLLGIVAMCRALGVPVQAYLAWAFERLGTHREEFGLSLEEITPAAFKASRGWRPRVRGWLGSASPSSRLG